MWVQLTPRPYAEKGHARAIARICVDYGRSIDLGSTVRAPEREQAFAWCRQAAAAGGSGHSGAQFYRRRFYHCGTGVAKDRPVVRRWYTESAGRGHAEAEDAKRGLEGKPAVCRNWVAGRKLM